MLFVKAKSCEQRNEKYFSLLFSKAKFGGQKNKQKKPKEQSFGLVYLKYI